MGAIYIPNTRLGKEPENRGDHGQGDRQVVGTNTSRAPLERA